MIIAQSSTNLPLSNFCGNYLMKKVAHELVNGEIMDIAHKTT